MNAPFITLLTPTFRLAGGALARPRALAACVQSVLAQVVPVPNFIQHEIVEDAVLGGSGVGGMFRQVPSNAWRVRGDYVHMLADDDVLLGPNVVARLYEFIERHDRPPVVIVDAYKRLEHGLTKLPIHWSGVPVQGQVDLGCIVTRRDVWVEHCHAYGGIYEGDFLFLDAVYRAGHRIERFELDFVGGAVMRGAPELAPTPVMVGTWG
jgi:hypothetical protein